MHRKIFSSFVACLVMICLLPSCSFLLIRKDSPDSADKKFLNNNTQYVDYIIFSSKFLNFFRKNEGNQLELVKQLDREDTDIRYWTEFFRKPGDIYAVRSSVSSKMIWYHWSQLIPLHYR